MFFKCLIRLIAHLLQGVFTLLLSFPTLNQAERETALRSWAQDLLTIVNIRLSHQGTPPTLGHAALVVSNHISWLDIIVIHSQMLCYFVSKAEVARWPVIGWMAEQVGTLFLTRGANRAVQQINTRLVGHLQNNHILAIFPEGQTGNGLQLRNFHAALFEPAVQNQTPVHPVYIHYRDAHGKVTDAAGYYGNLSFWQSLRRIIKNGPLIAEIQFLPPIASEGMDRKTLAKTCESAIRARLMQDIL